MMWWKKGLSRQSYKDGVIFAPKSKTFLKDIVHTSELKSDLYSVDRPL